MGGNNRNVTSLLEYLWPSADSGQIDGIVRLTREKLDRGEKVTGWPTVEEHFNPKVIRRFREWTGLTARTDRHPLTDMGNAERFIDRHGQNVRYCAPWDQWLYWDGVRWVADKLGTVREMAKDTILAILDEAKDELDPDRRNKVLKHAIASASGGRSEAMLRFAQTDPRIAILPEQLDQHPWLLNLANGTLDLERFELREHRREDLITKVLPVAYLPNAACPIWEWFIANVTLDRERREQPGLARYLQQLVGYCLTGDTTEKMLPMLWGPGDTGKTTFTEIMLALLGDDYATTTAESTIAAKSRGQESPTNDLAALRGTRLVVVSETSEGMQLNEGRIKALTGRNPVSCRFLFQEWFTYLPEFKLFIETNHKPLIKGTDTAIWNRVKPIPFTNVVPKEQQDKRLPDKLRAELPGILNWALAGLADWKQNGMQEPAVVTQSNAEYREHSDALGEFITERCQLGADAKVRSGILYRDYNAFMEERGLRPLGDQKFSEAMRERGFQKKEEKGYGTWRGIALKTLPTVVVHPSAFPNQGQVPTGSSG